jgi:hypothetical protein
VAVAVSARTWEHEHWSCNTSACDGFALAYSAGFDPPTRLPRCTHSKRPAACHEPGNCQRWSNETTLSLLESCTTHVSPHRVNIEVSASSIMQGVHRLLHGQPKDPAIQGGLIHIAVQKSLKPSQVCATPGSYLTSHSTNIHRLHEHMQCPQTHRNTSQWFQVI